MSTPKLTPEQRSALVDNGGPLFIEDDQTQRTYVIVERAAYERAIAALRSEQTLEAIREGVADMEAGRVAPIEEVCERIRTNLGLPAAR
jgi:predicted transcriptional regulator